MPGYRRTHDYPHGKHVPLVVLNIAMGFLVLLWVFFVPGHWPRAVGIISAFLVIAFIDSKLHSRYQRTGLAVRIPRRRVVNRFSHGLPLPMLAARLAFFATVATMIAFGFAPLRDSTARIGIIGCVFGLIVVAILNLALEHRYVNIGVAREVDVSKSGNVQS
jgi:hypothetical protein